MRSILCLLACLTGLSAQSAVTVFNSLTTNKVAAGSGITIAVTPGNPGTATISSSGGAGAVTSVNGQAGVVVLTTTDITEGLNRYWTDSLSNALYLLIRNSATNNPGFLVNLKANTAITSDVATSVSDAGQITNGVLPAARYKGAGVNSIKLASSAAAGGNSISIGPNADASGSNAIAIGFGALGQVQSATALGDAANAAHTNSTAIGQNSSTTRTNQIMLGIPNGQVNIPGDLQFSTGNAGGLTNFPAAITQLGQTIDLASEVVGVLPGSQAAFAPGANITLTTNSGVVTIAGAASSPSLGIVTNGGTGNNNTFTSATLKTVTNWSPITLMDNAGANPLFFTNLSGALYFTTVSGGIADTFLTPWGSGAHLTALPAGQLAGVAAAIDGHSITGLTNGLLGNATVISGAFVNPSLTNGAAFLAAVNSFTAANTMWGVTITNGVLVLTNTAAATGITLNTNGNITASGVFTNTGAMGVGGAITAPTIGVIGSTVNGSQFQSYSGATRIGLIIGGAVQVYNSGSFGISSSASDTTSIDVRLSRSGVGIFEVNNGTKGTITGSLMASNIWLNGVAISTNGFVSPFTLPAIGSTGNQTINKPSGSLRIAAAGTSATLTNNLITTNSIVICQLSTVDTTAKSAVSVPATGSAVITLNASATAEVEVRFVVFNPNQ